MYWKFELRVDKTGESVMNKNFITLNIIHTNRKYIF